MYFRELHQRLIDVARERVRAGEFTVRGLARIAGMSQPHMQNALKGIRSLSPDAADRLMRALSLSIPDPNWLDSGLSAPTIGVPLFAVMWTSTPRWWETWSIHWRCGWRPTWRCRAYSPPAIYCFSIRIRLCAKGQVHAVAGSSPPAPVLGCAIFEPAKDYCRPPASRGREIRGNGERSR